MGRWTLPSCNECSRRVIALAVYFILSAMQGLGSVGALYRIPDIEKLTKEIIPADPTSSVFDIGNTIGPEHRAWKRAKFLQQFRLFFRYDTKSKIIIYGWVNDDGTKRTYGSKTDAYRIFQKRLAAGDPSTDWNDLMPRAAPVGQE